MRIGILTLHDSPNYGAVLQACALRRHLAGLGHSAFVIDRRRSADGAALRTPPPVRDSVRLLGMIPVDAANGARAYSVRCGRTLGFLRREVGLSPYHFTNWGDAPRDLGVDLLVVGSDQVWNANNHDPEDYLLASLPGRIPGVAYAASIGMPKFPEARLDCFRRGLARFSAIGVREREAVEMVRALGFPAEQVVDPVLLAGEGVWSGMTRSRSGGGCFAYFLAEDIPSVLPALARHAARTGLKVRVFADWFVRKAPRGLGGWLKATGFWRKWRNRGIVFCLDAGPEEFVREIAAADEVVSNSYHALMFSLVFGKRVALVSPSHPVRRQMNSRFHDFEPLFAPRPLLFPELEAALEALREGRCGCADGEKLRAQVDFSRAWLARELAHATL